MWENWKDVGEIASAIIALGSAAVLAYRRLRPHFKAISGALRGISNLVESGSLDHIPAALSQLRPNGGDSLLDRITRIELALLSLVQKNRHLFSAQRVPFWESDALGQIVYASEAYAEIAGLNINSVLGNGWVTALHSDARERVFAEWEDAVEQKRAFIEKYRFIHRDQQITHVQAQALPVLDAKGNVTGFVGTLTPIDVADI